MPTILNQNDCPLKDETDKIIGLAIEVHKILGPGFLEIVYKDAMEMELRQNNFFFQEK